MNIHAAKAQAETLTAWADSWGAEPVEGAEEIAYMLRRTAKIIHAIASGGKISQIEMTPPPAAAKTSFRPDDAT